MHPAKFHIKLLPLPFASSSSSQWTAKLPPSEVMTRLTRPNYLGLPISWSVMVKTFRWSSRRQFVKPEVFLPWWPSKAVGQFSTGHQLSSWAINVKCEQDQNLSTHSICFLEVVDLSSDHPPNPSVVQTAPASKHPWTPDSKTSGIPKSQSSHNLHPPDNRIPLQPIVGPW